MLSLWLANPVIRSSGAIDVCLVSASSTDSAGGGDDAAKAPEAGRYYRSVPKEPSQLLHRKYRGRPFPLRRKSEGQPVWAMYFL